MRLNTLAGRSHNDLTQYPVMPTGLADYTSKELDLSDPASYRDLSKPMGAQEEGRAAKFKERFDTYQDCGMGSEPFHYGSHYSSAGIVLYYLLRMEPYTTENIRLQGGRFDVADRLFDSISQTWASCLKDMSDVKELVPEFFYLPDFLRNANDLGLGTTQRGHTLGDVGLPPWANGSADEFVRLHREALESGTCPHISTSGLTSSSGTSRTGHAQENLNVFYYLTYEGAVDLERLDPQDRSAEQQIHLGQTPAQLIRGRTSRASRAPRSGRRARSSTRPRP